MLVVWLPLTGDLHNQGLSNLTFSLINNNTYTTINNNGKIGRCYFNDAPSFNRGGITSNETIDLGTKQSMFCWIKFITLCSNSELTGIITHHQANQNTGLGLNIKYVSSTTGYLTCSTGNGTRRTYKTYLGSTLLQANTWYHIGLTYDEQKIKFYVNGRLDGEHSYIGLSAPANIIQIFKWDKDNGGSYSLNGYLNDIRIYDHALSAKEVEEIAKGLVLHYKLDRPNDNLITQVMLNAAPWATAIKAYEAYQGKMAYRVQNNTLYSNTSNGTTNVFPNITFADNTQYTLSLDWRDDYRTDSKSSSLYFRFQYTDGSTATQIVSPAYTVQKWTHNKMTSASGKTVSKITTTYGNSGQLYIANLKLEKGNIETAYIGLGDQINNSTVYDSSGYSHNGTIVGNLTAAAGSPRYNCSITFNNNPITITSPLKENIFSFGFWIKFNSSGTPNRIPFGTGSTNNYLWTYITSSYGIGRVGTSAAGNVLFKKINDSSTNVSSSEPTIRDGLWHYYFYTNDGSTYRLYIDGALVGSVVSDQSLITLVERTLYIGGFVASNTSYNLQNEQMSDFRLYSTCLADDQIKELYNTSMSVDSNGNVYARELVETT